MREYNNSMVYEFFNNPFKADFGSPTLNLPPITIDDRTSRHKRDRYTSDPLPATIYSASEKYVSTLTNPSASPKLILLPSDDTNH